MIHYEDGKEGCRAAAQAYGRRDVRGNGIGPTEQQVTTGHHSYSRYYCIKHDIERVFP